MTARTATSADGRESLEGRPIAAVRGTFALRGSGIGRRRFTVALLAAASLHALAVGWQTRARRVAVGSAALAHLTELQIELDSTQALQSAESYGTGGPGAATSELNSKEPISASRRSATVQSSTQTPPQPESIALAATTEQPEATDEAPRSATGVVALDSATTTALAAPSSSAQAASASIDLGLDGRMLRPSYREVEARQRSSSDRGAELQRKLDASFRTAAVTDDARRGYGRGNIFVGALSSAVRLAGPPVGEAVISASFNAVGELNSLTLVRGTTGDWSRAIQAFRAQAKHKRVPMPSGAKGLRITFRVATKIQKPSGKETDVSAMSVKRPSLAANGLTFRGDFDLADLSGKSSQAVSAGVLSEEILD